MGRNALSIRARSVAGSLLRSAALSLLMMAAGSSAAPQSPNPPEIQAHETTRQFRIRAERNLVVVRAVVRDGKGRTVGDLQKADFRLFDDGKPQEITAFSVEAASPISTASEPRSAAATPGTATPTPQDPATAVPQRFIALFFDDLHTGIKGIERTRDAAWRYVATAVQPRDHVAVLTATGKDELDFTDEQAKLHEALFHLGARPHSPAPRPEEVDMQTRYSLQAIEESVRHLVAMPGQRTLVLVSPGFPTETAGDKIDAIVNRALQQEVVISAIDAAGFDARTPHPTTNLGRPTCKTLLRNRGWAELGDVLASLSSGTGGVFFHDSDDFDEGFREAAAVPEVSYVLAFSPQNVKLNGKFHSLKVTLNIRQPFTVQARRGYFASETGLAEQVTSADELEKVVFSLEERHELPAEVSTKVERLNEQRSTLTVSIHVNIASLRYRKEAERSVDKLIFNTALFDRDGRYVAGKEGSLELHLKDATLEKFSKSGINAQTRFEVGPGTYRVREVVRDSESTGMSALNCEVQVPGASL